MHPYQEPDFALNAFNCPHCHAYAKQDKVDLRRILGRNPAAPKDYYASICSRCHEPAFWEAPPIEAMAPAVMIYPSILNGPMPNTDLSEDITRDFNEARQIEYSSPRAAAALLRLAIQKLCKELGAPGDKINNDIKFLVEKGLSPMVQQSLDIVRVVGNESVHPGTIDLNDDPATARQLFVLVNLIAETMITQPRMVQQLYNALPADKRAAIEQRDKNKNL